MPERLIRKLDNSVKISDEDKRVLNDAARDIREFGPRQGIIREGDKPDHVHLMIEGWAGRYKMLPNGGRSIMAYLIPGDLCDVQVSLLNWMDHSIGTLSAAKVAFIPRAQMDGIIQENGTLARALWWRTLVNESILREWLVTVGHRSGDKRIAHLLCEILLRSRAAGLAHDDSFDLPPTQDELADSMGMSAVHMNRMLQELRREGLITTHGKQVQVRDLDRLMALADFDPNYLHYRRA